MTTLKPNIKLKNRWSSSPIISTEDPHLLSLEKAIQENTVKLNKNIDETRQLSEYLKNNIGLPQIERTLKNLANSHTHTNDHAAATVADTTTVDMSITGQQISAVTIGLTGTITFVE